MNRKFQWIGLVVLMLCSIVYDFQMPENVSNEQNNPQSYVVLEGAFLKQGKYEFEGDLCVQDIVEQVGVLSDANLDALSLNMKVKDEMFLYLPKKNGKSVSLNHATKEELMTLDRVGEKIAQKIIDYRTQHPFTSLEDIMNVPGIGEKTYQKLREYLCL